MAADTDQNGSVTFGEFKKDLLDLLDLLFGFVSEADDGDGAARENGDCRDHSERHGGGDGGLGDGVRGAEHPEPGTLVASMDPWSIATDGTDIFLK